MTPPSYRQADKQGRNCGTCKYYSASGSVCKRYAYRVKPGYVCRTWKQGMNKLGSLMRLIDGEVHVNVIDDLNVMERDHMNVLDRAYAEGFMKTCEDNGISPEGLVKSSAPSQMDTFNQTIAKQKANTGGQWRNMGSNLAKVPGMVGNFFAGNAAKAYQGVNETSRLNQESGAGVGPAAMMQYNSTGRTPALNPKAGPPSRQPQPPAAKPVQTPNTVTPQRLDSGSLGMLNRLSAPAPAVAKAQPAPAKPVQTPQPATQKPQVAQAAPQRNTGIFLPGGKQWQPGQSTSTGAPLSASNQKSLNNRMFASIPSQQQQRPGALMKTPTNVAQQGQPGVMPSSNDSYIARNQAQQLRQQAAIPAAQFPGRPVAQQPVANQQASAGNSKNTFAGGPFGGSNPNSLRGGPANLKRIGA